MEDSPSCDLIPHNSNTGRGTRNFYFKSEIKTNQCHKAEGRGGASPGVRRGRSQPWSVKGEEPAMEWERKWKVPCDVGRCVWLLCRMEPHVHHPSLEVGSRPSWWLKLQQV